MFNSTFRQLEAFISVVRSRSFAKAALELGISQPGISRHIKALEEQCGGPLLIRAKGSSSSLTPLGEILYARAPRLVQDARALGQELAQERQKQRVQRVRVTGHPYVLEHILREILPDFLTSYSRAAIHVSEMKPEVMQRLSGMQSADLAFIMTRDQKAAEVKILGVIPCALVAHPSLLVDAGAIADQAAEAFILPLPGTVFEREMLEVLRMTGRKTIKPAARTQYVSTMRDLTLRGRGIAYLPMKLVEADLKSGALIQLDENVPLFYLGLIMANGIPVNATARLLIMRVEESLKP